MASRGVNKVILVGNLGADPEMKYTPSGKEVTTFSMAVNRTWRDGAGEQHKDTTWLRIETWGKLAQTVNQYARKGQLVYVEGRLKTRSWDAPDGTKRYATEIVASEVTFLDRKDGPSSPDEDEANFSLVFAETGELDEQEMPF